MKRRISLLLAVVMVLGSFGAVFATDVSTTEEAAAQFLNERDILLGNTSGDLGLDEYMKRQDSVIMLSRLMGKEDAAKEHIVTEAVKAFKDVKNSYYRAFISWAVEEEYIKGKTPTKFGNDEDITARDYAVVLLRALGYGEEVATGEGWKNAFETATKLGLVKDLELKGDDNIRRGQMAVMTVNALNTKVKDGDKTLAEELGIDMSMPVGDVEVKAVSEKEIEVKFANKISEEDQKKAEFVVTDSNNKEVKLNPVEWNKAGDTVVLKRNFSLTYREGTYTVEIKGLDLENNKFEVKIAKAKAEKLEIKENVVSLGEDTAKVTVESVDQYGNKKEVSSANLTLVAVNATTGTPLTLTLEKKLELKVNGKNVVNVGDEVAVTALDTSTGLSVTKELEVVAGSVIDEIVLGDVLILGKDGKVTDHYINGEDSKVYVELNAFDQYGDKIKIDSETKDVQFFATGLEDIKVADVKDNEDEVIKEFSKESQYIELGSKVKTDAKEASLYAVIVRATGVVNSNVVKFDVESAGGAVEFKLDDKFEPVINELTTSEPKGISLKFFNKFGKEVTSVGKDLVEVKSSNTNVIKAEYENGEVVITEAKVENDKLSSEADIVVKLKDENGKVIQEETLEMVVVKSVAGYSVENKTTVKELTAGDEISLEIKALRETDKVHEEYNKTEKVTITVDGKDYFRDAKFDKGVARVTVPVTEAGTGDFTVKTNLNNADDVTITGVTVKAAAHTKFILEDNNTIKATDKFDNVVESYTGDKTGKLTSKNTLKEVKQGNNAIVDAEGTLKINFDKGEAKEISGLTAGKYTIELGGITSELEVPAAK